MAALRSSVNLRTTAKLDDLDGNPAAAAGSESHVQFSNPLPRLSITKPSWVVKTESNVWREKFKKPKPPCVICDGTGRVDCFQCQGKGRTNCANLAMLPRGEWPKWCKNCGGSGLAHCSRCLGSGEFRDVMGFHFMKRDETHSGGTYRKTNGSNLLRDE